MINICFLCDKEINKCEQTEGDMYKYVCDRCGQVSITEDAVTFLTPKNKPILSGILRNRTEFNKVPIDIFSNNIGSLLSQADIPISIPEKLDKILQYLVKKADSLGEMYRFDPEKEFPISYSKSSTEFRYLLNQLEFQDLVKFGIQYSAVITPKGWDRINVIRTNQTRSDQAFIAMWFSTDLEKIYNQGIESAIIKCGYRPLRVDKLEHNGKICDAIIAEIRRSAFLVADFTGHRGGVYFEAGFAMGLGIPVIWLCKESDIGEAHFDTRQYNHILWNDENELAKKLCDRINATIVRKPDNIVSK